jgi:hypothetical protein
LPKSTKRKHAPSSSDSEPSHKAATQKQKFLTIYTSCIGKRKPPSILVDTYKTSKPRAPTGGTISTGKRIREPSPTPGLPLKKSKPPAPSGGDARSSQRKRALSMGPTHPRNKSTSPLPFALSDDNNMEGHHTPPYTFSQDPIVYPDSKDNP